MSTFKQQYNITLWAWPASDCSARLRIALNLKGIPYELKNVDLSTGERPQDSVNSAQTVPVLVISSSDGKELIKLTQSVAALEYLEEAFPNTHPLLPPSFQPEVRARVRMLMDIITTDIHPLKTHRVADRILDMFVADGSIEAGKQNILDWRLHWIRKGLMNYEKLVSKTVGKYSVGNSITMADICLMPEVSTARKLGLKVEEFPLINGLYERLIEVHAFKADPHFTTDS